MYVNEGQTDSSRGEGLNLATWKHVTLTTMLWWLQQKRSAVHSI